MRPVMRGIPRPSVAILPDRPTGLSPPKPASTRDKESTRAPLPPRISAWGMRRLVMPALRRRTTSAASELPRASRLKASAKRPASGAISVPSPTLASVDMAELNPVPGRNPLPSSELRASIRAKPSLARAVPSTVVRAACAWGVRRPRKARVCRTSSIPRFHKARSVPSAPDAPYCA